MWQTILQNTLVAIAVDSSLTTNSNIELSKTLSEIHGKKLWVSSTLCPIPIEIAHLP